MNSCIAKPILGLTCCGLSLGLLILSAGCGRLGRSVEHAEVSGKVLYQGKPLPGGVVNFVTVKGSFANTCAIDENGNYQLKAPVGEVQISVQNRMLQNQSPIQRDKSKEAKTFREKKTIEIEQAQPSKGPLKGRYVAIPDRYNDPSTSGLIYTVKPGSQTHDIELSE